MKIIVTHNAPDWDAITSTWLLKRFLPDWNKAESKFVPAGSRLSVLDSRSSDSSQSVFQSTGQQKTDKPETKNGKLRTDNGKNPIEFLGKDEIVHVDTGMGSLDHHQTSDQDVSAASRTFDYVLKNNSSLASDEDKKEAIGRIVKVVVETDHFKEVFWENPIADYHEFSLLGVLEGVKLQKPGDDTYCMEFGFQCLDALLHNFENRIWAEKEIAQSAYIFETRFGRGIGFEIINDSVLKLAQKMGYMLVVRKDPRKGYVRIKARPDEVQSSKLKAKSDGIDLTNVYKQLRKMDPEASWFLHVSKKMLLNGTPKNPKMIPTKLSLQEIISVLKNI